VCREPRWYSKRKGEQIVSESWDDEESELDLEDEGEPDIGDDLELDSWDDAAVDDDADEV